METVVRSLFALIQQGDLHGVGDILKVNPSIAHATNSAGVSPIMFALYCGRPDMARTLAALRGTAPSLFESAAFGELKAVRLSLERSPDLVNQFAKDGFSLLHLAAFFGHAEMVAYLLEKGGNPNAVSRNDAHLHVINSAAAQKNHDKSTLCVRLLLESGADPNASQKGGYTATHAAAMNGNLDLLRLLKSRKASFDRKTDDGKSPLDLAQDKNQAAAIAFLQA